MGTRGEWESQGSASGLGDYCSTRVDGGLAFLGFQEHAALLKMRCVSQLIANVDTAWVDMVGVLMRDSLKIGIQKKERKRWTPSEALLLHASMRIAS